jgi:gamma-glutamyltranspeptidase/glutathione hydrolase
MDCSIKTGFYSFARQVTTVILGNGRLPGKKMEKRMQLSKHFQRICLYLFFLLLLAGSCEAKQRVFNATGAFGAVSCGHPLATKAAARILENGGNAVDAAVAAAFMLGVVDFTNSGPGGDAFALVHFPNGKIMAYDASIRRPASREKNKSFIGLPTEPELLLKLLQQFGSRSAVEVLAPAIKTCIDGFKVSSYLNRVISAKLPSLQDRAAIDFLAPDGYAIPAGAILKQPLLAQTLQNLARDLGNSFYRGEDAMRMVAHMQSLGSTYSPGDLKEYSSSLRIPIRRDWQNFELYGNLPPSSSIAAMNLALSLADSNLDLFSQSVDTIESVSLIARKIIDHKYNFLSTCLKFPQTFFDATEKALKMDISEQAREDDSQTTHLCVWDKNGMAVSMTLTLGSHCGTGELSPLGFFYNNEMRNYTPLVASYPADYPENAGPISSKAPLMIKRDGELAAILGGAGSDRIIFNVGLNAARIMRNSRAVMSSALKSRYFLDYLNVMNLEWNPDSSFKTAAEKKFKKLKWRESGADYFGLISMILKQDSMFHAIGDYHRDGDCQTIELDPERARSYKIELNFSRKKGFKHLRLAGPIQDWRQKGKSWISLSAQSQVQKNGDGHFDYSRQKKHSDLFSTFIEVKPENRADLRFRQVLQKKPVFTNRNTAPEIAEFATNYLDCQTGEELVRRLLIDIGFSIPYSKTRKKTSALKLLEKGQGDCSGKARLLHKVLTLFGFKSRLVGGIIANKPLKTSTHLWVEVYDNGYWLAVCPVNFCFGQTPANWLKFRYGETQTTDPGGKLIFNISEMP